MRMATVPEQQGTVELSPRTRSEISREKMWRWKLMGCALFPTALTTLPCHMDALPSYEFVLPLATRLAGYQHGLRVIHIG